MTSLPWFPTSRSFRTLATTCGLFIMLVCITANSAIAQTVRFNGVQTTVGSGFAQPEGVAVDSSGNVFVADSDLSAVFEIVAVNGTIPASPTIRTLARGVSNGLVGPWGIAVDGHGNVYVADSYYNKVYEILAVNGSIPDSPTINTLAAGFNDPMGLGVDANGDVYVADYFNGAVKEIVAVNGSIPASPAINVIGSGFRYPTGVALDSAGNVYVADWDHSDNSAVKEILAVNGSIPPLPVIRTLASPFGEPYGVAVDQSGNVFVADADLPGIREILAVDGSIPASPVIKNLGFIEYAPESVAVNGNGDVFVGAGNSISEILPSGPNFGSVSVGDTSSTLPLLFQFSISPGLGSISVLTQGATGLDFADAGTGTCKAGTAYPFGATCTINVSFTPRSAGTRYGAVVLKDTNGNILATAYLQGTGIAPQVTFLPDTESTVLSNVGLSYPSNIAVDATGSFYIMDTNNSRVVKATLSAGGYTLTTVATGLLGAYGVALDGAGDVYIGDTGNQRVLKEAPTSTGYAQTTVASGFGYPIGVAVDASGNVYIADQSNGRILEETLSSTGYTQSTIVTGLNYPNGVAVDGSGNLYVADTDNLRLLKETLTPSGYVQSTLPVSSQVAAQSIAVDGLGNVYFEDALTDNVFKETLTSSGYVESTIVSDLHIPAGPFGVAVDGSGNVYVAYSSQNSIVKADFADPPSLTFATTTVGSTSSDSPQTVTLQNIGNADLTLPIPATGNNPSIASGFSIDSNAPSACPVVSSGASNSATVPAGTSCELPVNFSPTAVGAITGSLVLTDNNLNAPAPGYASQTIQLSGVGQAVPIITWPTPALITYGTALSSKQLDATANVAGTFVYAPALGSVLTAGPHTLTLTFTPTDTTDYTTASASVVVTVNKATPIITWPTPAPITYSTALSATQLNATANVPGTFAYSPAAGTIPPVGTDTLSVTFTPTDAADYTTANASVLLTVNPASAPSFTLSASPASLSIVQNNSATATISVTELNGFTGKVNLAASGLPSGVTASFSTNPATSKSTLTLKAGPKATTGKTTVTITGTSGNITLTTTIQLTVASRK